ncbi:MAG: integrase arm-type DNA-binding domain-containing protein [Gammaproteobacteria bacterium]|nr:integrase arm-type DNA-binding domain-containing protein [Gammaproteobacteria bacterium]
MNNRPLMLSATFVRNANRPGRYGDGRGGLGLGLLVRPALRGGVNKPWTQSVRIDGRATSLGLGRYPVVTLAMARERALENARAIAQGRDPRRSGKAVPTFAEALETVIGIHAPNWKDRAGSERQWRASLAAYALPRLGAKTVDAVTSADVMAVLLPIWSTKRVTAGRVRQRIGAVMKWAVAQGLRADNPAGDAISAALPRTAAARRHQRALPHAEVRAALARVRDCDAHAGVRLAFEFLVLTATRSGEVRNARWEEIDRDGAVWTIPAERMKNGREHRVPLSDRALEVLDEARELAVAEAGCSRRRAAAPCTRDTFPNSCARWPSTPSRTASARASATGPPSARTRRARSASSPWRTSAAIAWRPPTGAATCSTGAAR